MKMKTSIGKRLRGRRGFTVAEVLLAMLILLMATAVVAAGIPAAANAYHKVVDSANAQILLSTTMTRLRSELSTASQVQYDGTTITYLDPTGSRSVLTLTAYRQDSQDVPGIYLQEYADVIPDSDLYKHPLVSRAAADRSLYVTYRIESYTGGVITFADLSVNKAGDTIVSIPAFQVRVLSDLNQ